MSSVTWRRPEAVIQEEVISLSGKYLCFFGAHFEKGHVCYLVGTSNKETGEILMRHYNSQIKDCIAPKASALTFWEEFKTKMTEKSENEGQYEDDENSAQLEKWFERAGRPN